VQSQDMQAGRDHCGHGQPEVQHPPRFIAWLTPPSPGRQPDER
jgi:hypothetical protein